MKQEANTPGAEGLPPFPRNGPSFGKRFNLQAVEMENAARANRCLILMEETFAECVLSELHRMPPRLVIRWKETSNTAFPSKKAVKLKNQIISISQRKRSLHAPGIIMT